MFAVTGMQGIGVMGSRGSVLSRDGAPLRAHSSVAFEPAKAPADVDDRLAKPVGDRHATHARRATNHAQHANVERRHDHSTSANGEAISWCSSSSGDHE